MINNMRNAADGVTYFGNTLEYNNVSLYLYIMKLIILKQKIYPIDVLINTTNGCSAFFKIFYDKCIYNLNNS